MRSAQRSTKNQPSPFHLRSLSPDRRRLVELIGSIGFGKIEAIQVCQGEPIITPETRVFRQLKFQGGDYLRVDPLEQVIQHEAFQRLFDFCDQVIDERILLELEIKFGLPFLGVFEAYRNR